MYSCLLKFLITFNLHCNCFISKSMLLEGPSDVTCIRGTITRETSSAKLVISDEDSNFLSKSSFSLRSPAKSKFSFFFQKENKYKCIIKSNYFSPNNYQHKILMLKKKVKLILKIIIIKKADTKNNYYKNFTEVITPT